MNPVDIAILIGIGVLIWLILTRGKSAKDDTSTLLMQEQLKEMRGTLDTKLGGQGEAMQRLIRDITRELTKVGEGQKQVIDTAKQLESLQNILKNPKQRGMFGEYTLEVLLKGAFTSKQYKMQYKFKDGEIVDAVLFMGDKILPIDSKFSLENYNRIVEENDPVERERLEKAFIQDIKKRIDETAKYIRPEEGTMDFAFMFIPADGIHADLMESEVGAIKSNTRDLIQYAVNDKKVHIVSPTTFYVVLQSMWQGIRDYQIQESTKEILKNVGVLSRHLKAYQEYHDKLGVHLGTVVNAYNKTSKEFLKIDKDVTRLDGKSVGVEVNLLEKPAELEQEESGKLL